MNRLLLLLTLLTLGVAATAQEKPSAARIEDSIIQKGGASLVDQFKAAVKKIVTCKPVDLNGTYTLFSDDAFVEVSRLGSSKVEDYPIRKYFDRLFNLHCGPRPKYRKLWINFDQTVCKEGRVSWVKGGSYTVVFNFNQDFIGETADGRLYKDLTIKQATLMCTPTGPHEMEIRIVAITVENTLPK